MGLSSISRTSPSSAASRTRCATASGSIASSSNSPPTGFSSTTGRPSSSRIQPRRIFGYPVADAMVGESVMSIVPEHRREAIRERIDSILRDRTNAPRMEQVLLRRDGSTVHAESSATWCTFKDVPCVQALIRERPPHEAVGGHAPSASAVNGAAHHAAKMDAVEGR
ncbi:MAG: PAS domain S-box protein [Phycisphaerales bacterium]